MSESKRFFFGCLPSALALNNISFFVSFSYLHLQGFVLRCGSISSNRHSFVRQVHLKFLYMPYTWRNLKFHLMLPLYCHACKVKVEFDFYHFPVRLRPDQLPLLQPLDEPGALDEGRGDAGHQGGSCLVPSGSQVVSQCSTWPVQCSYLAT